MAISAREQQQIDKANQSGRTPVVFIHGLWLIPSSWDNWVGFFEQNGYAGVTPDWPDDPGRSPRHAPTPTSSPARSWSRSPVTSRK